MKTLPMRPARPDAAAPADMFRETLQAILAPRHALLALGCRIDRAKRDVACGESFIDQVGRPGLPPPADGGAAHPQALEGAFG